MEEAKATENPDQLSSLPGLHVAVESMHGRRLNASCHKGLLQV